MLVISTALRIWIAGRGGQIFWPDEGRYEASRKAIDELLQGDFKAASTAVFARSDHLFFKLIGTAPAMAQHFGAPQWVPAVFFGLFSVGCIYLIWRIALITAESENEALFAATFAATSASLFYYSRHYFPYDLSLFLALLGLYHGISRREKKGAFLCGVYSSLAFLTYNGYWLFCGTMMSVCVLYGARAVKGIIDRVCLVMVGLALPILTVLGIGRVLGVDLIASFLEFSRTVTLGDYDEGWTFVLEYFWNVEQWLLVLWIFLFGVAIFLAIKRQRQYLLCWLGSIAIIYVGLAWMCVGAHKFVIYGRIARCLAPLFALTCAGSLNFFGRVGFLGRVVQASLVALIVILASINFSYPVRQYFPTEFRRLAIEKIKTLPAVERPALRVLNAHFFHQALFSNVRGRQSIILQLPHPLQYRPYLYDGYSRSQRFLFDAHDITMKLVSVGNAGVMLAKMPDLSLDGYLGPLRIEVMLPRHEAPYGEPLVVTGATEAGDFVYLGCDVKRQMVRVGFDHWSRGGPLSEWLPLSYDSAHVIEVSIGSLMPLEDSELYRRQPTLEILQHRLFVTIDGRVVFNRDESFFPAQSMNVTYCENLIGGSSTMPTFDGQVLRVTPADPASIQNEVHDAAIK